MRLVPNKTVENRERCLVSSTLFKTFLEKTITDALEDYEYLQHQQGLYHVFIDFKKAFDRVCHTALWATMKKYNISTDLIRVIINLYNKATSAVLFKSTIGDCF